MKKEVKDVVRMAQDYGFTCVGLNGSDHWTLRHKSGVSVTVPCSPRRGRWRQNAMAQIKRIDRQAQKESK